MISLVLLASLLLGPVAVLLSAARPRWAAAAAVVTSLAVAVGIVAMVFTGASRVELSWLPTWGAAILLDFDGLAQVLRTRRSEM